MSKDYPCIHWNDGKCKKFSDDKVTSWCVWSPCASQTPSNADRIRSMSDEELAKFIDDIAQSVADGEYCTAFLKVKNFPYSCEDTKKACVAHVIDWLQQPAEESDND